jgi:ligand-binding SRPBCC domain-containing protein
LVTGDFGDEIEWMYFDRVTPRFRLTPTVASATNYYKSSLGDAVTQGTTIAMNRNRFNFMRDAHWHRVRFDFSGAMALNGLDVSIVPSSQE